MDRRTRIEIVADLVIAVARLFATLLLFIYTE
jgi:hypothetical protein